MLEDGKTLGVIPAGTLKYQLTYALRKSAEMSHRIGPLEVKIAGTIDKLVTFARGVARFAPKNVEGDERLVAKGVPEFDEWEEGSRWFDWEFQADEDLVILPRLLKEWSRSRRIDLTLEDLNFLKYKIAFNSSEGYLEELKQRALEYHYSKIWYDREAIILKREQEKTP